VPASRLAALAAVWTLLTAAALGSAVGGWVGWHASQPLLSNDAARELVQTAVPGADVQSMSRRDAPFTYLLKSQTTADRVFLSLIGDDGYAPGSVYLTVGTVADQVNTITQTHTRLKNAGWTTAIEYLPDGGRILRSAKGQLAMEWDTTTELREPGVKVDNSATVLVAVYRREPSPVRLAVLVGGLVGAVFGWLGAVVISQRLRATARLRRGPWALASSITGLGFLLPATAITLLFNVGYAFSRHPDTFSAEAPWLAYMWPVIRTLAIAGVVGLVVAIATACWPAKHHVQQTRPDPNLSGVGATP
jgi:hypothetical protein